MMKPEYCPDYVGVACVDGTCPVANREEYAERCMPVISCCRDCFYVIAMANHNMNVTDVARAIFAHRNTVLYHLDKVKRQTGLDPRRFYDLVELVKMAQEVLENGS